MVQLYISILFCIISFSNLHSQNTNAKINKEFQRIENLKTLEIDSLTLTRGVDFNRGSNVDQKKYKIFKERNRVLKIEYQEINDGYRKWIKKTTIYFKNETPFFIIERINGETTLYLIDGGEKSEPHKVIEEIYIYDWSNEKIKRVYNGHEAKPQMKICKTCYEELIEKLILEFK